MHTRQTTTRRGLWLRALTGVAGAGILTGCGAADNTSASNEPAIAVLVGVGSNAYQSAGVAAIEKQAEQQGVDIDVLDATADASKQYAQFQTAINSGKYNGILINPLDGSGVVPLVKEAQAKDIKVGAWNQPIGSDFTSATPSVPGVTTQAMLPLSESGRITGELTKQACAEAAVEHCQVAVLYYKKGSTYDTAIMAGFEEAVSDDPRIEVVAGADTEATRQGGLAGAQTILAGNPGIDVMIGTSQAVTGAAPAVAGAQQKVYLIGQALTRQGADEVKSGVLFGGTQAMAPEEGKLAFEQLVNAIEGKPFEASVDPGAFLKSDCVDGVTAANVDECSFDFNG